MSSEHDSSLRSFSSPWKRKREDDDEDNKGKEKEEQAPVKRAKSDFTPKPLSEKVRGIFEKVAK